MSIKVRENNTEDASLLLSELHELLKQAFHASVWLRPYADVNRQEFPNPMKYVMQSKVELQKVKLGHFNAQYPHVRSVLENGGGTGAHVNRLQDAIYKIGTLTQKLAEVNCVIKSDDTRRDLFEIACDIAGDLCVVIIGKFEMHKDEKDPFLAVVEYTQSLGISHDVFYGMLLQMMRDLGRTFYGYEEISPVYEQMLNFDEALLAEAEEAMFPLTEDICQSMLSGELGIAVVRGMIHEHQKKVVYEKVDPELGPLSILSKMRLE